MATDLWQEREHGHWGHRRRSAHDLCGIRFGRRARRRSVRRPFSPRRVAFFHHRVAPSPAPGAGVIRLGAARHFCDGETVRRAELRGHFHLADIGLRQHAGGTRFDRRAASARHRRISRPRRKLGGLDLPVRARARQALGEMAPVRRDAADSCASCGQGAATCAPAAINCCAQRDDRARSRRACRARRSAACRGFWPTSLGQRVSLGLADLADHVACHHQIGAARSRPARRGRRRAGSRFAQARAVADEIERQRAQRGIGVEQGESSAAKERLPPRPSSPSPARRRHRAGWSARNRAGSRTAHSGLQSPRHRSPASAPARRPARRSRT